MRVRVPPAAPRRRGLRIVRDGVFFFKANAVSHSLRRSSFPDRTRFAWLRSGQGRKAPPFVWYPYLVAGLEQGGGLSESPPHGEEKAFAAACAFSPALAPGLLLSKSNPLRWASICFSLYPAPYPISSLAPRQNSTKDHLAAQAAPNRPKELFFLEI